MANAVHSFCQTKRHPTPSGATCVRLKSAKEGVTGRGFGAMQRLCLLRPVLSARRHVTQRRHASLPLATTRSTATAAATAAAAAAATPHDVLRLVAPHPDATAALAAVLARMAQRADCFCLYGACRAGESAVGSLSQPTHSPLQPGKEPRRARRGSDGAARTHGYHDGTPTPCLRGCLGVCRSHRRRQEHLQVGAAPVKPSPSPSPSPNPNPKRRFRVSGVR